MQLPPQLLAQPLVQLLAQLLAQQQQLKQPLLFLLDSLQHEQHCAVGGDWVGGRQPLPFGACVTATHSSFQWDHHMDAMGDAQLPRAYQLVGAMGYNYFITALSAADAAGGTFTVTASIENRGVAPAYYPVSLTLNYPCGASGANSSFAGPLVSSLMPGDGSSITLTSAPVTKLASSGEACVLLTSPRAIKPIKFAMNEQDAQGLVRVKL